MSFPYRLTQGEIVYIDDRPAKFHCELPDDRAQFLDAESFRAVALSAAEVRAKFLDRTLRFTTFRSIPIELRNEGELTLEHFPDSARADMWRRKEYVDAVDAAGVQRRTKKLIEPIIMQVALGRGETAPHYKTVAKWLDNRGAQNRRRLTDMRTRNDRKGGHSTLGPFQSRVIAEAIESVYQDSRQLPVDDVWSTVVTEIANINRSLPQECHVKAPSRATVYRRVRRYRDYKTTRLRQGAAAANKIFRWVGEAPEVEAINDLWIVDATILDNIIVLDASEMILLGNPTFTAIMDSNSRILGGWYLGFEPPSHLSMALALRHAISPKLKQETTRPDGGQRTLAEGVPFNLLMDNGKENKSPSMKDALGSIGINPLYAPRKDPEYKGIIERFFLILKNLLIQKLPGNTKIGSRRRTEFGIDPQKDAIVTLDFLNELILDAIDIYNIHFHTTIKAAPEDAWKRGLKKTRVELPASLDSLNVLLGRLKKRTLDRKGVRFEGLRYGSNDVTFLLDQLLPLSTEKNPKDVFVKIKFDPGDLGAIWVLNPVTDQYVKLPCLKQKYASGLTLHHHRQIVAHARLEHRKLHSEEDYCAAKVALRRKLEAAFGGKLLREKKRAARIVTVQNKRFIGDVLQIYDEAKSSLSTLDQTLEDTILVDRDDMESGEAFFEQPFIEDEDADPVSAPKNSEYRVDTKSSPRPPRRHQPKKPGTSRVEEPSNEFHLESYLNPEDSQISVESHVAMPSIPQKPANGVKWIRR
jgi:putative transposase